MKNSISTVVIFLFVFFSGINYYFYLKYRTSLKSNSEFIKEYQKPNFINAYTQISGSIEDNPYNPVYYANLGLLYSLRLDLGYLLKQHEDTTKREASKEAISNYLLALHSSPFDDLYMHNLSVLYFYINQIDSSKYYLSKAINQNPGAGIYYITQGLIYKNQNQLDSAYYSFIKGIEVSPEILDSEFFEDIQSKDSFGATEILKQCEMSLKNKLANYSNPIDKAKLAKINLSQKKYASSISLLQEVTMSLPNLNRPWSYLGEIYLKKKDYNKAINHFEKAILLDRQDIVPKIIYANYCFEAGKYKRAKELYDEILFDLKKRPTDHSISCPKHYLTETVPVDIIPSGYFEYCKPFVDTILVKKHLYEINKKI